MPHMMLVATRQDYIARGKTHHVWLWSIGVEHPCDCCCDRCPGAHGDLERMAPHRHRVGICTSLKSWLKTCVTVTAQ